MHQAFSEKVGFQQRTALYAVLFLLLFAPLAAQYVAITFHHYGIGLVARILVHIVLPVLLTSWLWQQGAWQAFTAPILAKNSEYFRWSIKTGLRGGAAAVVIILGAFLLLQHLLDFDGIRASLLENFRVRAAVYPAVALAIVVVNPFLEEYFWRGFIYRAFSSLTKTRATKRFFMVLTGFFFALHHVVIVSDWFNWWQFLLSTVFLAIVGVLFNWMYERSGSIIASWITHAIADLVIVAIGFHLFGFI